VTAIKKKPPRVKKSPQKIGGKKRSSLRWKIFLGALFLLALLPFYYKSLTPVWRWFTNIGSSPHYPVYKNFHIRIPNQYAIHGIDVSAYQGTIDWHKVKNMHEDSMHISFAYIKATEGVRQADPYFARNWRECLKAGITCGAYHYFEPKMSGRWQAAFFLKNITLQKGNLPLVVDIEELDGIPPEKMRLELDDFLKDVAIKTKTKGIIYSGLKFYKDNLEGYFKDYSFWLSNFDHPELAVSPGANWKFWQHSDRAKVNGIWHGVDFDVFKGDSLAFKALLVK
jgi:lysozyme